MTSPVFVDATGRRARVVMAGCWALAALFGSYVLLVVMALVLPPGTLSLSVPGLGPVLPKTEAPPLTTTPGSSGVPVSVLAKLATAKPRPVRAARHLVTPAVSPSPVRSTASRPTAVPSASAAPTAVRGTGKPSTHPTPRPHASKTPPAHP